VVVAAPVVVVVVVGTAVVVVVGAPVVVVVGAAVVVVVGAPVVVVVGAPVVVVVGAPVEVVEVVGAAVVVVVVVAAPRRMIPEIPRRSVPVLDHAPVSSVHPLANRCHWKSVFGLVYPDVTSAYPDPGEHSEASALRTHEQKAMTSLADVTPDVEHVWLSLVTPSSSESSSTVVTDVPNPDHSCAAKRKLHVPWLCVALTVTEPPVWFGLAQT